MSDIDPAGIINFSANAYGGTKNNPMNTYLVIPLLILFNTLHFVREYQLKPLTDETLVMAKNFLRNVRSSVHFDNVYMVNALRTCLDSGTTVLLGGLVTNIDLLMQQIHDFYDGTNKFALCAIAGNKSEYIGKISYVHFYFAGIGQLRSDSKQFQTKS